MNVSGKHYLDSLYDIFVSNLDEFIDDEEFARLSHVEAISYYKLFFQNRSKSLKEKSMIMCYIFLSVRKGVIRCCISVKAMGNSLSFKS